MDAIAVTHAQQHQCISYLADTKGTTRDVMTRGALIAIPSLHAAWCGCPTPPDAEREILVNFNDRPGCEGAAKRPCPGCGIGKEHSHCPTCGGIT